MASMEPRDGHPIEACLRCAPDEGAEQLREAILDLEIAKEHESQLRQEANVLLQGLRALSEAKTPEDLFLRLLEALRAPLLFDAAFVMRPLDDESLFVDVSTDPIFVGARFAQGKALRRALDGKVTTFLDAGVVPEWQAQPEPLRAAVGSALCLPLKGDAERALVVFTRRDKRAFQARHEQLARRFQPLAIQALRDVERTNALHASNRQLSESLERLQKTQRQLIQASRRAGMADVATTVLHNVGNVLNSVNVSAGVTIDLVRRSRIGGLARAVEAIRTHSGDLGAFLSTDAIGRRLPDYLSALAGAMGEEHATMTRELVSLQGHVDHIKTIIGMQQSLAGQRGVIETVPIGDLVEEALSLSVMSHDSDGVRIVRDFGDNPTERLDRDKMLQLLTNLLGNARHAVLAAETSDKRITIRLHPGAPGFVAVEVEDNGCGIAPENLDKIFNFGFTTKKNGHGFGLHSSACSAAEMGGTLSARSDGPGKGATFTLLLPRSQAQGPS